MASGAAQNRMLAQKGFFHTRMTYSQSLMVTYGTLKFNYVTFVDAVVQINKTQLNSLATVASCL